MPCNSDAWFRFLFRVGWCLTLSVFAVLCVSLFPFVSLEWLVLSCYVYVCVSVYACVWMLAFLCVSWVTCIFHSFMDPPLSNIRGCVQKKMSSFFCPDWFICSECCLTYSTESCVSMSVYGAVRSRAIFSRYFLFFQMTSSNVRCGQRQERHLSLATRANADEKRGDNKASRNNHLPLRARRSRRPG